LLRNNITGNNNANDTANGILAFNDRVLAVATPDGRAATVYDVFIDNTGALARTTNPTGANLTALQRCTDGNTRAVNGRGTAVVRCVFDNGTAGGEILSVIVHNGAGTYSSNAIPINPTSGNAGTNVAVQNIRFGANSVLVVTRDNGGNLGPIYLCSITITPLNVSCSATDLPNLGNIPIRDTTRVYPFTALLKFHENDVLYRMGTATLRVGDIFGTQQTLSIPTPAASGGNASFDLTRFASGFQPVGKTCATQIRYLSSRTAGIESYDIAQPSGACVERILKVY